MNGLRIVLATLLVILAASVALAESVGYELLRGSVGGGGGGSSGGTYAVSASVGERDPGPLTGGSYTVDADFAGSEDPPPPPSGYKLYLPLILR
ncbi:MAG: hypothetical protein HYY30_14490 [Chloroflexi bacterium]|nr:hypothetical protein [Chloroflexota bacterium]